MALFFLLFGFLAFRLIDDGGLCRGFEARLGFWMFYVEFLWVFWCSVGFLPIKKNEWKAEYGEDMVYCLDYGISILSWTRLMYVVLPPSHQTRKNHNLQP